MRTRSGRPNEEAAHAGGSSGRRRRIELTATSSGAASATSTPTPAGGQPPSTENTDANAVPVGTNAPGDAGAAASVLPSVGAPSGDGAAGASGRATIEAIGSRAPEVAAVAALELTTGKGVNVVQMSDEQRSEIADKVKVGEAPRLGRASDARAFVPNVPLPSLPGVEDRGRGERGPEQARRTPAPREARR